MGAEQPELRDHGIVGVVDRDQLVSLIGKRRAALAKVLLHLRQAVEDAVGRDQLVARMGERRDGRRVVVHVLRLHVAADYLLTGFASLFAHTHGAITPYAPQTSQGTPRLGRRHVCGVDSDAEGLCRGAAGMNRHYASVAVASFALLLATFTSAARATTCASNADCSATEVCDAAGACPTGTCVPAFTLARFPVGVVPAASPYAAPMIAVMDHSGLFYSRCCDTRITAFTGATVERGEDNSILCPVAAGAPGCRIRWRVSAAMRAMTDPRST